MKKKSGYLLLALIVSISATAQSKPPSWAQGQWLHPETNEWIIGFAPQFAVYENEFWSYQSVSKAKGVYAITLSKKNVLKKLLVQKTGNATIKIGADAKHLITLSSRYNENPQYGRYETLGFKEPLIKKDSFHVKGWLIGYDADTAGYRFVKIILNHLMKSEQASWIAEVDSLGRFDITIPLLNPQDVMLTFNDKPVQFYAVPGKSVTMGIESAKYVLPKDESKEEAAAFFKRRLPLVFMGQPAKLNAEYNAFMPALQESLGFFVNRDSVVKLNADAYKKFRLGKMRQQLNELNNSTVIHGGSVQFFQLMESEIRYAAANDLLRYRWLHDRDKRVNLPAAYLSFIQELPLNSPKAVLSSRFYSYLREVNNLEGSFSPDTTIFIPIAESIAQMKKTGFAFTPEEEKAISQLLAEEAHDTTAKFADTAAVTKWFQKYSKDITEAFGQLISIKKGKMLLAGVQKYGKGAGTDALLSRVVDTDLRSSRLTDAAVLQAVYSGIGNDVIRDELKSYYNEAAQKIKGAMPAGAVIIKQDDKASKEVWEKLLVPYRGKVVYVDFWAPWCGPCMNEMSYTDAKKEMEGKDAVFLYLGVNCSKKSWENAIKTKDIKGEHYLLSDDEYSLLSNRFQISGIPRYLLVNKKGEVVNDDAPRPSEKAILLPAIHSLLAENTANK